MIEATFLPLDRDLQDSTTSQTEISFASSEQQIITQETFHQKSTFTESSIFSNSLLFPDVSNESLKLLNENNSYNFLSIKTFELTTSSLTTASLLEEEQSTVAVSIEELQTSSEILTQESTTAAGGEESVLYSIDVTSISPDYNTSSLNNGTFVEIYHMGGDDDTMVKGAFLTIGIIIAILILILILAFLIMFFYRKKKREKMRKNIPKIVNPKYSEARTKTPESFEFLTAHRGDEKEKHHPSVQIKNGEKVLYFREEDENKKTKKKSNRNAKHTDSTPSSTLTTDNKSITIENKKYLLDKNQNRELDPNASLTSDNTNPPFPPSSSSKKDFNNLMTFNPKSDIKAINLTSPDRDLKEDPLSTTSKDDHRTINNLTINGLKYKSNDHLFNLPIAPPLSGTTTTGGESSRKVAAPLAPLLNISRMDNNKMVGKGSDLNLKVGYENSSLKRPAPSHPSEIKPNNDIMPTKTTENSNTKSIPFLNLTSLNKSDPESKKDTGFETAVTRDLNNSDFLAKLGEINSFSPLAGDFNINDYFGQPAGLNKKHLNPEDKNEINEQGDDDDDSDNDYEGNDDSGNGKRFGRESKRALIKSGEKKQKGSNFSLDSYDKKLNPFFG